ncbi:cyclic AMP-responsive element-binding protein 5-like [Periophthalmus magnuspinnatus]|uniref:cyclic AMP-responsive element-binding protein 5-like n=1 Tax=Periophthalmus magnuspinnatus TaxID=409849 RepID=UPI00145AF7B7|nr:cyclic AMP-responsive element-binding protein 5-like [Periophthalmus magnuspinnatus]XP_055081481.1 cyclic AMP-responsive element-binding protein 5-like [Periophthalmus magnuspinnatus]XP_055081482.1 cyclic AMP-responsive element-binding protein 5-like [Periophthalmus magnuspinnatus]
MNELLDRPYVCGAPGCSQRFQSEEHLSIHRHKHEMTLKFNSIKSDAAFTADTPTPTKFLQNCDEVGLFKEIEEEFLQAQEEEKKQIFPQNGPSCLNQSQLKDQGTPLSHQPLSHPLPPPQHHTQTHSHSRQPPHHHSQPHHPSQHHPPHHQPHNQLHNQPHSQPHGQTHQPHSQSHSQPLQHPPAHGPLMGPSCSLAPHQAGSVITQNHSHSGPVPSPLSSLLHMRSRHRQPLPASLPGTLPDPAMQGAAAHHVHRLKHPLGPPFPQPRLMPMNRAGPPMGHMMDMMSPRQQAPPLQHHPQLSPPPVSYQQRFHIPPPQHIAHGHSHHLHQNVPPTQAHQSPPPRLHPGSPPAAPLSNAQLSPVPSQPSQCQLSLSQGGPGSCAGPSGPPGAVARRRRTSEQDPDERRQKFLERNRAAATRCRQKRKLWVSSLEKKAEELTHTNLQLQNEVTSLRSEVGQLKQILLTHKDCPVTARQREGQGFSSD